MREIRYHNLRKKLNERHMTLEGLRRRLRLLPSDIIKIETERPLDPIPLYRICKFFDCDVPDLMVFLSNEEQEIFYSRRILETNSYVPMPMRKKEFHSDVFQ